MTQRLSLAALCASALAIVALAACGFFNPLDQGGYGVVLLPRDTAVYVGAHFQERGLMMNGYGDQYSSEHITYAGLDSGVTVGRGGVVTGLAYARARVAVMRDHFADTGWVSVVPVGRLALSKISDQSSVDIVNSDGSGFRSIVSSGQYIGGSPSWLPGDTGIVYQYAVPGGAGTTKLFVTDLAGNTRLLYASGGYPRVSRDGTWVYFDNSGEIWRVHVDGSGAERVAGGGDSFPDPSPDGTQVASTERATGRLEVAVRTLATGAQRLLGVAGWFPRWGPQGDSIAYISAVTGAVFVIGADGTGARQVSAPARVYRNEGLDWSPDGKWLLARSNSALELIQVGTGLTLPLGYSGDYFFASWAW